MRRSGLQIPDPVEGRGPSPPDVRAEGASHSLAGIRAVLFDLDNTLYDHVRASREALVEAARTLAPLATLDGELLCREFERHNDACWILAVRGEMEREVLRVERFRRMLDALGVELDAGPVSEAYLARYAGRAAEVPGAREVVFRLLERGPVGIVTNGFTDLVAAKLEAIGLAGVLSPVVVAERIEDMKPRPAIFHAALAELDLAAEDVLVVGDSLAVDVAGGRAAGLRTCWFNRHAEPPPVEGLAPDAVLTDLLELPGLLDGAGSPLATGEISAARRG